MQLSEDQKERLRTLTVEALLDLRAAYLGTPGANALKHWELLQNRLRSNARTSSTPEEWLTAMLRGLQLPAPSSGSSHSFRDLTDVVRELGCAREWLDLLETEFGYLIAVARGVAEQRKEARNV